MTPDLLYNLALAAIDAGVVLAWVRRPGPRAALWGLFALAAGGLVLARALGEDFFGFLRLVAWGVFLHGGVALAAGAVLLARPRPRLAVLPAVLLLALSGIAFDAFLVEPTWLETTEVLVRSARIDREIAIAVVADLQTDRVGDHEKRALELALEAKPDLVLMPGDHLQERDPGRRNALVRELRALLAEISFSAPLGVYAVGGNVDPPGWESIYEGTSVVPVVETRSIELPGLAITALSFRDSFDTRLEIPGRAGFHIVLGHAPDFALGRIEADLLVAGHTHGGQVRLPFLGPLVTLSRVPRSWAAGTTRLDGGRTLVVSRGIGHERGHAPRLRFLCRPELVIVRVSPTR